MGLVFRAAALIISREGEFCSKEVQCPSPSAIPPGCADCQITSLPAELRKEWPGPPALSPGCLSVCPSLNGDTN